MVGMDKRLIRMRLICILLAAIAAGMCAWAIINAVQVNRLEAWIMALENGALEPLENAGFDSETVAAEYSGGIVTVGEAYDEYETIMTYYEMLGLNADEYAEEAKLDVLKMLVERRVLEDKARELGVFELDAAALADAETSVRVEYEDNVEYYMAFRREDGKSEEEVRSETVAYLEENGYSYDDLLAQAEQNMWQDRLYEAVTRDVSVSDDELLAFYQSQLENAEQIYAASYDEYEADCEAGRAVLWHPEGVRRVQVLLISFDAEQAERYADIQALLAAGEADRLDELDSLYAALEPEAEALLARVRQGEDFTGLMAAYGGGKAEGECISQRSVAFGDELRDAAMALEELGDVSGIVRCDGGLCILRYASDVVPGAVAFDEVKDALRESYLEEKKQSCYNAEVAAWLNDADARYYPERF